MSKRVLFHKPGFIFNNAPLKNGLGRFIPQLQRLTLKFCKEKPSSLGVSVTISLKSPLIFIYSKSGIARCVMKFVESNLVSFAEKNPHVVVYLKPRRRRSPVLVAEFLNGERHWQSLYNYTPEEVQAWVDIYTTHSGKEYQFQEKWSYSDYPTVQGLWTPFTHADPSQALLEFPLKEHEFRSNDDQTVTQMLLKYRTEQ